VEDSAAMDREMAVGSTADIPSLVLLSSYKYDPTFVAGANRVQ